MRNEAQGDMFFEPDANGPIVLCDRDGIAHWAWPISKIDTYRGGTLELVAYHTHCDPRSVGEVMNQDPIPIYAPGARCVTCLLCLAAEPPTITA